MTDELSLNHETKLIVRIVRPNKFRIVPYDQEGVKSTGTDFLGTYTDVKL